MKNFKTEITDRSQRKEPNLKKKALQVEEQMKSGSYLLLTECKYSRL